MKNNKRLKNYEELTLTDDFLFCKIMESNKDLCQKLVELIIDKKIKDIVFVQNQKSIDITADSKSIRLDVYLEDDQNTIYDLEMQTTSSKNLPKRSRYYQGMMDLNLIQKGADYHELKESFVIFICLSDPFYQDKYLYYFENKCREDTSLSLHDLSYKVFLNANGKNDNEISPELRGFLRYLVDKNNTLTDFTKALDAKVNHALMHEEWRVEYMTLLMRDRENQQIGKLETLANFVQNGIVSLQDAADNAKISVHELEDYMMENGYSIPE